jgi:hypothetical protein
VIFAVVSNKEAGRATRNHSGFATAGLIIGIIGLAGFVLWIILIIAIAASAPACGTYGC